jgi:hypothetical protein
MNATVSDSGRKAKLAASITPASREMEGLPVSYQPGTDAEWPRRGVGKWPARRSKAC